ncbi:MAG: AI-2E family transporter [Halioglobus sp.]|nr:AI-2E family transporter [Halioglobus sp.]
MNLSFPGGANRIVLLVCLTLALYACYWLLQPFLEPILLAMLIGILAMPAHRHVQHLLRGRDSLAALLSCLILLLLFLIPLSVVMVAVISQGIDYSLVVKEWATMDNIRKLISQPYVMKVHAWLDQMLPEGSLAPENIRTRALSIAGGMGEELAALSTALLGSVTRFFINGTLLLFVLFFVLRDHDRLMEFIRHALPLSRTQEDVLFKEVRDVSKSALLGSLLTAITQGFAGGFALWLAGFPGVFWGVVMAFTSLIPVVGTALIWVPAALYLLVTGEYAWAAFLAIWGVVVVGSIDNFLRPMFMQGASMNTVVVFFSLLGGLQVFGLMGLIYGPLIFAITLVLFRLYEAEFEDFLDSQDRH